MKDIEETRQKIRKSNVRIVVTYFVVFMYCTSAVGLTVYLMALQKYELALGVFNGLATLAAGIAGFWFGSRGTGFPEELPDTLGASPPREEDQVLIGPKLGETWRNNPADPDSDAYSPPLDNK